MSPLSLLPTQRATPLWPKREKSSEVLAKCNSWRISSNEHYTTVIPSLQMLRWWWVWFADIRRREWSRCNNRSWVSRSRLGTCGYRERKGSSIVVTIQHRGKFRQGTWYIEIFSTCYMYHEKGRGSGEHGFLFYSVETHFLCDDVGYFNWLLLFEARFFIDISNIDEFNRVRTS